MSFDAVSEDKTEPGARAESIAPEVTVSLVSHRQTSLANQVLADLKHNVGLQLSVILTQNVEVTEEFDTRGLSGPVEVIVNARPKGFAANHNAAFARCRTPFFCVLNPDLRIPADPFPALVAALGDPRAGVAGPLVRTSQGRIEDSARKFPTAITALGRLLRDHSGPDYPTDRGNVDVDWIAGMCMLFRSEAYRSIGGFDESYHLYYEDADICRRLRTSGWSTIYCPNGEVVHDAQRTSRRSLRYARYHLTSAIKFFFSSARSAGRHRDDESEKT